MYSTTLISILLAVTFAAAIPIIPQFPPLENEGLPDDLGQVMQAASNQHEVEKAAELANQRLPLMEHILNNPTDPRHAEYIQAAFGRNANIDKIKANVAALQGNTAVVPIKSRIPKEDGVAWSNPHVDGQDNEIIDQATNRVSYENLEFGHEYFAGGMTPEDQASKLIHESIHVLAGGEDDVVKPGKGRNGNAGLEFYQIPDHGHLPGSDRFKEAGYLFVKDDANPGKERYVKHAEILQHGPAAMTGPNLFTLVRDRATGMENNPDSYSFLSSLAVKHHMEGLCTRALYKRALTENDPVGYYLAKRQECTLPPDYFEKKMAAKKAAADAAAGKPTSDAANTAKALKSQAGSKAIQKTRGVPSTKASKALGAKKDLRASKSAKRRQAVKAAKATKDLKTKAARGSRSAKALRAAKAANGREKPKATKGSRFRKESKVGKAGRSPRARRKALTQAANAAKKAKALKAANRRKSAKGTQGSRALKGKATKSVNNGKGRRTVNVTKGRNPGRATKAGRGRKGITAAKSRKGPKKTQIRKGGRAGKGIRAKGANGANGKDAGKKGARASKRLRANNRAKSPRAAGKRVNPRTPRKAGKASRATRPARATRPDAGRAGRTGKQNTQKTKKNNQVTKSSNQGGNRGNNRQASKAIPIPKVQQQVTKAAPAAKFVVPQKGGKRN